MSFFHSLIEREPIHVKSVLKEEENVHSSLAELLVLPVRSVVVILSLFFLLMVCKISLQAKE